MVLLLRVVGLSVKVAGCRAMCCRLACGRLGWNPLQANPRPEDCDPIAGPSTDVPPEAGNLAIVETASSSSESWEGIEIRNQDVVLTVYKVFE